MPRLFLATPGPVNIPDSVYQAMCIPYYHRSSEFAELHFRTAQKVSLFFDCSNPSILMPCSGTGIMEMALINILNSGDKIICLEFGKFSERFRHIAERIGCHIITIKSEYGSYPHPEQLQKILQQNPDTKAITCCHSETSTGVLAPIKEYANIIAHYDGIFIVDAISSVGTTSISQEEYHIDICLGAGHKGFMIPPGIGMLSYYGDKINNCINNNNSQHFYFDLKKEILSQSTGFSQWTPAISLIVGLNHSTDLMLNEGKENIFNRHKLISDYTLKTAIDMGLQSIVKENYCNSPSVSGFFVKNPKKIVSEMKNKGIILAEGQGDFTDQIIRIGHLGEISLNEIKWVMDTLSFFI